MNTPGLLGEAGPRLVDDAPALALPSWLPPGGAGWPVLADLGERHRGLLARQAKLYGERRELEEQFEREDKEHRAAMAASFATDEPSEHELTPPAERQAALTALSEQLRGASDAIDTFLRETVAVIEEHVTAWTGDLTNRREGAADKRREAERLLAEARAEEVGVARLEQWLLRNAGVHERRPFRTIPSMRFVTWDFIEETFMPPPAVEQDGRPQLVDPPSIVPWDAEQQARRKAAERQDRAAEQEEFPERFLPDEMANPHR